MTVIENEAPSGTPDEGNAFEGDTPAEPVEAVPAEPTASDGELYTIKVDGQEQQVTLEELQSGHMRQQDYTRKTQEVAEMRKRLQSAEALASALDKDPVGTLQALNEHFNVPSDDGADWDDMDPQEQRMTRLEHELRNMRARDAQSTIDSEFRQLEEAYGEVDRADVANYAIRHGIDVPTAYRAMHFDNLRAEHQRLAQEAKVVGQKRSGQLPTAQSGAQRGAVTPATSGKLMNIRESYRAALKQAGM